MWGQEGHSSLTMRAGGHYGRGSHLNIPTLNWKQSKTLLPEQGMQKRCEAVVHRTNVQVEYNVMVWCPAEGQRSRL